MALAAVYAARPVDIRRLQLDHVELGDRRLVHGGAAVLPADFVLIGQAVRAWIGRLGEHNAR